VAATQEDIKKFDLIAPIVGHVGDGNFHVAVLLDMSDAEEVARAKKFNEALIARSLSMDGTCTGEHGVGEGKIKYLEAEHGAVGLAAMRGVKHALDPDNIMNPGKIFAF
jgi:D-lactate dehydrogenase (cytochrome)